MIKGNNMFSLDELKKIRESLTDLGDIVWNDEDDHDSKTISNLDEALKLINDKINSL
jgi:hypothetical protein